MNCYHCGNKDNEEWVFPKSLTVFDGKPVTNNTPHELMEAIQHGAIVCTYLPNSVAMLRPADSEETCYVFWDGCKHMSMPYASLEDAKELSQFVLSKPVTN